MDANLIIDILLEKIKFLTRENTILMAQLQTLEKQVKQQLQQPEEEGVKENA
ncbi:hypothetical protein V7128_05605 [Neobacillus vireti]|uniref:hypothetical protein n=1 Tax=Neobacillus vireti TaxID=220686 RepID=UPI002FFF279C